MSEISRRKFIGSTATSLLLAQTVGSVAKGELIAAPVRGLADRRLRVQFSPGGHTAPLQIYAMFEDPLFAEFESVVRAHPYAMDTVDDVDYPDIIVTNDWLTTEWPQRDKDHITKHLAAGRGLVVLHHAVGTNDAWKTWTDDMLGCHLYDTIDPGMKTQARLKQFPIQVLTPVGDHPIVRGMEPFQLPWDETFPNMWISPRAIPLFKTDDPSFRDPTIGWVGPPLPKGRVCAFQPGHTDYVCQDPNYRNVVRNMILWTGGRLA
jgi:type 1 glutamine amidotransferase